MFKNWFEFDSTKFAWGEIIRVLDRAVQETDAEDGASAVAGEIEKKTLLKIEKLSRLQVLQWSDDT